VIMIATEVTTIAGLGFRGRSVDGSLDIATVGGCNSQSLARDRWCRCLWRTDIIGIVLLFVVARLLFALC
jgi:hypothetical protein